MSKPKKFKFDDELIKQRYELFRASGYDGKKFKITCGDCGSSDVEFHKIDVGYQFCSCSDSHEHWLCCRDCGTVRQIY